MDAASFILGSKISEVYAQLETLHKTRKRPLGEVQTYSKAGQEMKYATYPVETEDYAAVLLRWGSGVFGSVRPILPRCLASGISGAVGTVA